MLAITSAKSASLVGVFISVTTVPAAAFASVTMVEARSTKPCRRRCSWRSIWWGSSLPPRSVCWVSLELPSTQARRKAACPTADDPVDQLTTRLAGRPDRRPAWTGPVSASSVGSVACADEDREIVNHGVPGKSGRRPCCRPREGPRMKAAPRPLHLCPAAAPDPRYARIGDVLRTESVGGLRLVGAPSWPWCGPTPRGATATRCCPGGRSAGPRRVAPKEPAPTGGGVAGSTELVHQITPPSAGGASSRRSRPVPGRSGSSRIRRFRRVLRDTGLPGPELRTSQLYNLGWPVVPMPAVPLTRAIGPRGCGAGPGWGGPR